MKRKTKMTAVKNVLFCVLLIFVISQVDSQGSNCATGRACDKCPRGEYKVLKVGRNKIKLCCSNCGKYFRAGYQNTKTNTRPYCTCDIDRIGGDCWKGDQCTKCLNGPNKGYVGRINTVPVCCKQCEASGLELGPTLCNCRHNGP